MTWDKSWDNVFRSKKWGKYPPEELIRFIARNFYQVKNKKSVKILDLGCATGACTWYLAREGFSTYGIDGSQIAIKLAHERLEKERLKSELIIGDITKLPYPNNFFDAVTDIVAIECNTLSDIQKIISEVHRVLKKDGKFFSMCVKVGSFGYRRGKEIEKNTFTNIKEGPHLGQGTIHFFGEEEIKRLMRGFQKVAIEYSERSVNNQKNKISHWVISAENNL